MRRAPVMSLLLLLLAFWPAGAGAQSDDRQLSAEEFLSQSEDSTAPTSAPAPAAQASPSSAPAGAAPDAALQADAAKAAELFGDDQRKRQMTDRSIVRLRTIDKLSARTHTFEIPVGKTVKFGKSLFIKARACRSASALDEPENAAFLQIWERQAEPDPRTGEESRWVFSGWMFSSSPSLSAMEHPIYDVWVIECKNDATTAAAETYSAEKAPETAPQEAAAAAEKDAPSKSAPAETTPTPARVDPNANGDDSTGARPAPEQMAPVAPVSGGGGAASVPALQELPGSFEDGGEE